MARAAAEKCLSPVVRMIVSAGISANAVTALSLLFGVLGGAALALDRFELAVAPVLLSYLGDALDGLVARRTEIKGVGGAIFDAAADRYQELFILGGLALLFRTSWEMLCLALLAIAGSFMVSYGSAKAEAFDVPVPTGVMRRGARAAWVSLGVALVPVGHALRVRFPETVGGVHAPVLFTVALIAVIANGSAVVRLQAVAAWRASQRPDGE